MITAAIANPNIGPWPMSRGPRTVFRANDNGAGASWIGEKLAIGTWTIARDPGPRFSNRIRSMAGPAASDQWAWFLRQGLGLGFTQTVPGTVHLGSGLNLQPGHAPRPRDPGPRFS